MISAAYIKEWRRAAPWQKNDQVEQDLIISRALVEIFNQSVLAENLAFRGGTALYKLHVQPVRYSEDIDLVQVHPGPIGSLMDALKEVLNPWLGNPKRKQSEGRITLTYRMTAESGFPLKLKVEINSREHFSILGLEKRTLDIQSRWFSGSAAILTYQLDELLGTKMRALYQRKKGRDLFDLWKALNTADAQPRRVIDCFLRYMKHEGHKVSQAEFEQNLIGKLDDPTFVADVGPLLITDTAFDFETAARDVINKMLPLMPGEPWQG
ncbi:MAG TPA: nucleotidyl transferase AbiEii/AbiGii toxin family protein [Smithella sp.]|jgi:predicted nucleotidyltransferase component of viral defense system|nr:nucleotidyl transferase AbiEii/AbiGii toxin family protein [Smithella sp.]